MTAARACLFQSFGSLFLLIRSWHKNFSSVARATTLGCVLAVQQRLTMKRVADNQGDGRRLSPVKSEPSKQDHGSPNLPPRRPPQDQDGKDGALAPAGPAACISEDVPNDLFPVGKLVAPEGSRCVRGSVSSSHAPPYLVLTLDTFLTDIYRTTEWFLATDTDDTEASPRRAVLLCVTPNSMEGTTFAPRHMTMEQEGHLRITNIRVSPIAICGQAPRWLREQLSRWGDYWAGEIDGFLPDDATVYVRLGEVTRIRNWTPSFPRAAESGGN
jgi:hypothetical protein